MSRLTGKARITFTYNFDETPKDRAQKQADRDKKRALHSSIMQELRQEYYDEPEEIHDRDIFRMKSDKKAKEREAYEERNMTRLSLSKKEKDRAKRVTTMNSLKYLTDFQDFRGMAADEEAAGGQFGTTKKRKAPTQKKVHHTRFSHRFSALEFTKTFFLTGKEGKKVPETSLIVFSNCSFFILFFSIFQRRKKRGRNFLCPVDGYFRKFNPEENEFQYGQCYFWVNDYRIFF
jgi:hypothetical protein